MFVLFDLYIMKAKVLAIYLPQFHPIPENDEWWGPGFTEWTNVAKAKPLFKGHYQPRIPADLGFYDLRLPEVREKQAELAREAGIAAFCYYHYWFEGREILERPLNEVFACGKPDFPFCICWANHTWSSATWDRGGRASKILLKQTYSAEDDVNHFMRLLPIFNDNRYYKIDGRLVFAIYDVWRFGRVKEFIETWRRLAKEHGLPGFYFIGITQSTLTIDFKTGKRKLPNVTSSAEIYNDVLSMGFDAVNSYGARRGEMLAKGKIRSLVNRVLGILHLKIGQNTYDYSETVRGFFSPEDKWENVYPTIIPQYDRSPREATKEGIYVNSSPDKFYTHICDAIELIKNKDPEHQVIFMRAWNEWAEGNYVEPDLKYGHGWIQALAKALKNE